MLVLENAPQTIAPRPIGEPSRWEIYNPDFLTQVPVRNQYDLEITAAGTNGQTVKIAGVTFTVDDSTSYTASTWNGTTGGFFSAINLLNALRNNAAFRRYGIKTIDPQSGGNWIVRATAATAEDATAEEGDNQSGGGVTVLYTAGSAAQRSAQRLYYQFWADGEPVGPEKFAPFDDNGRAMIDGQAVAARIVRATLPDLSEEMGTFDPGADVRLTLKYGKYENDNDCQPAFLTVATTPEIQFIDAVRQWDDTEGMQPYSSNRNPFGIGSGSAPLQRWLTNRPNTRNVRADGYEWQAIYIGVSAWLGGSQPRRLRREYFDANGNFLGELLEDIDGSGIYRVPVGGANGIPASVGNAAQWTVQIQYQDVGLVWRAESALLTLSVVERDCVAAEIHYIESLGSWRVIEFSEEIGSTLATASQAADVPASYTPEGVSIRADVLYAEGGTLEQITRSREVFTFAGSFIRNRDRMAVMEMLESPQVFLREIDEAGNTVMRRVIPQREEIPLGGDRNAARLAVSFRYALDRRHR